MRTSRASNATHSPSRRKPSVHNACELAHSRSAPRTATAAAASSHLARRQRGRSSTTSAAAIRAHASARSAAIRIPDDCSCTPSAPDGEAGHDRDRQEQHGVTERVSPAGAATAVDAITRASAANVAAESFDFGMKPRAPHGATRRP